jgi:hypothetical protein
VFQYPISSTTAASHNLRFRAPYRDRVQHRVLCAMVMQAPKPECGFTPEYGTCETRTTFRTAKSCPRGAWPCTGGIVPTVGSALARLDLLPTVYAVRDRGDLDVPYVVPTETRTNGQSVKKTAVPRMSWSLSSRGLPVKVSRQPSSRSSTSENLCYPMQTMNKQHTGLIC